MKSPIVCVPLCLLAWAAIATWNEATGKLSLS